MTSGVDAVQVEIEGEFATDGRRRWPVRAGPASHPSRAALLSGSSCMSRRYHSGSPARQRRNRIDVRCDPNRQGPQAVVELRDHLGGTIGDDGVDAEAAHEVDLVGFVHRPHEHPVARGRAPVRRSSGSACSRCSPGPGDRRRRPAASRRAGRAAATRAAARSGCRARAASPGAARSARSSSPSPRLSMSAGSRTESGGPGRPAQPKRREQLDELLLDQAAVAGRVLGLDEQPDRTLGVGDAAASSRSRVSTRPSSPRSGATPAR